MSIIIKPTQKYNWSYLEYEIIKHAYITQKSFTCHIGTIYSNMNRIKSKNIIELIDVYYLMIKYDLKHTIKKSVYGKSRRNYRYEYYIEISYPDIQTHNCYAQNIYFGNLMLKKRDKFSYDISMINFYLQDTFNKSESFLKYTFCENIDAKYICKLIIKSGLKIIESSEKNVVICGL